MRLGLASVLGASAFVLACATTHVPAQQVADSQSAIRAAEAVGADRYPESALHLKMARDHVGQAQMLAKEGEEEEAVMALERAEVDAELALAMAQEEQAALDAQQMLQRVRDLQQQHVAR